MNIFYMSPGIYQLPGHSIHMKNKVNFISLLGDKVFFFQLYAELASS